MFLFQATIYLIDRMNKEETLSSIILAARNILALFNDITS